MFSRLRKLFSRTPQRIAPAQFREGFERKLRAGYESARTTDENERYWAFTDVLSPAASTNPGVRSRIRSRARYEIENNSYASGILATLSHDVVGTGPRLQVTTESGARNKEIELAWNRWADEVQLASKLRTARISKASDGEVFFLFKTNRRLTTPAMLDVKLIEADQIATPEGVYDDESRAVDGIRFDRWGNPKSYHLLKSHPGAQYSLNHLPTDYETVSSADMLHWFTEKRPNQYRGISELAPSLSLFAKLRRYTHAVIAAAETAADFAAVMYTDEPADGGSAVETDWFKSVPIEYRSMITLPDGWKMGQFKAEQPTTTYREFQRQVVSEMARCLCMPYNIAAGDSSEYNYSSGRLDHLSYWLSIDVERSHLATVVLEKIYRAWLTEHLAETSGISPRDITIADQYPHKWIWASRPPIDPEKHANAVVKLWDKGLLTDHQYLYAEGVDPDEHFEQLADSIKRREESGAPVPGVAITNTTTGNETDDESSKETPSVAKEP